ncbi:aspartate/glutamate racemase family protein [Microvirga sp. W0021]|uniref:Aspartate/glutamate racemase family protein n=1 Tax=Hohaiivirga grylli TaxID=3133970 RepID=A0ABV0BF53_9HYPH
MLLVKNFEVGMSVSPRIALVHALKASMEPIHSAFAIEWPQAELVNIWDDSLAHDRSQYDDMPDILIERIANLGRYAVSTGADAVLYTCSAFGKGIEYAAGLLSVPVMKPNEAMFEEALKHGHNIGMIASFKPSVKSMTDEFENACSYLGKHASLKTELITEAMDALRNGDVTTHNHLVADAAYKLGHCDAVMLAQFSMARAAASVRSVVKVPVLTAPTTSVVKLKQLFAGA